MSTVTMEAARSENGRGGMRTKCPGCCNTRDGWLPSAHLVAMFHLLPPRQKGLARRSNTAFDQHSAPDWGSSPQNLADDRSPGEQPNGENVSGQQFRREKSSSRRSCARASLRSRPAEETTANSPTDAIETRSTDRPQADSCDRCGEPVRDDRVIRISSEPCPELADRYRSTSRAYCPDCVASIGLLALATESTDLVPQDRSESHRGDEVVARD